MIHEVWDSDNTVYRKCIMGFNEYNIIVLLGVFFSYCHTDNDLFGFHCCANIFFFKWRILLASKFGQLVSVNI